jgi:hypothetical protein
LWYEQTFAYTGWVGERRLRSEDALHAVRAVVAQGLADRVRPLSLARDRVLPVHTALAEVFPEGGLRRGSIVGCQGQAAWSTALALAAAPSQAGSWVGLVGLGSRWGLSAAAEWGIALDRVFSVPAVEVAQSPTVLAAVADGVDLVITTGAGVRAGDARRIAARLSQRGGVLLLLGDPGGFVPDLVCSAVTTSWTGLHGGCGRLTARRVRFEVSGRRVDRPRHADLWFPGPAGTPSRVETEGNSNMSWPPVRLASVG